MSPYRPILIIGIIEIFIGTSTLLVNLFTLALSINQKTPNVLLFIGVTGILSTLLGIGLLKFMKMAYALLIYFSSIIIISKVLLLMGIIQLNGEFETAIPSSLKSCVSIVYHAFVIFYLMKKEVKAVFVK